MSASRVLRVYAPTGEQLLLSNAQTYTGTTLTTGATGNFKKPGAVVQALQELRFVPQGILTWGSMTRSGVRQVLVAPAV